MKREWKLKFGLRWSYMVTPCFAVEVGVPGYDVRRDIPWYGVRLFWQPAWSVQRKGVVFRRESNALAHYKKSWSAMRIES